MMSALDFGILLHRGKNGYCRGRDFLFIMHHGDADYGYLPSIVGFFFIDYLLGNLAPAKEQDGEGGLLKTPCSESVQYLSFCLAHYLRASMRPMWLRWTLKNS